MVYFLGVSKSQKTKKLFGLGSGTRLLLLTMLLLASPLSATEQAFGERGPNRQMLADFPVPGGFDGRIQFWIDIFAKYGKYHRVFHHREYPEIIYSVLDFSELEDDFTGKKLESLRGKAVKEEVDRIKGILQGFADGQPPKNEFEKRLQGLFKKHTDGNRKAYLYALDDKMIRNQSGIKERFREGVVRSGRYLYAIERIFVNEGLPKGLTRLPLIESSFDYRAYSSVGAAGIWQFMRTTAKRYMTVNASIDERRDAIISSRAAASYLRNSYKRTNDWGLAVTSYNHGLQGVLNAAQATGSRDLGEIVRTYRGKAFGFASANFYVELLAAIEVEQNAELYFPGIKRESPWYFDEVKLGRALKLADASRLVGTDRETLAKLNLAFATPILKNGVAIPKGTIIKVPPGSGRTLLAAVPASTFVGLGAAGRSAGTAAAVAKVEPAPVASSPVPVVRTETPRSAPTVTTKVAAMSEREYQIKPGESLGGIAKKLGVSTSQLMQANSISNSGKIRAGQKLIVPIDSASAPAVAPDPEPGVIGDAPARSAQPEQASTPVTAEHVVRSGETLGGIASAHGVSLNALLAANPKLDTKRLKVGSELKIPQLKTPGADSPVPEEGRRVASNSTASSSTGSDSPRYKVAKGDTLSGIAKKHGLSTKQLTQLNPGLDPRRIKPGQKIIVR